MARSKILIVSGDLEITRRLAALLEAGGDVVESFTDAAEAFQRVWSDDYDVILSEVGVSGIDGRDIYMALQNTWPELTRRMVFICTEPTETVTKFAARTSVPLLPLPCGAAELRKALSALRVPHLLV